MQLLVSALNLVLILSALVIAHELGHFLVAKACRMRVDDFSLFFGPRIWRIGTFNGTEYNIRSVPLGGYVKIAGMEPDDLTSGAQLLPPTLSHGAAIKMFGVTDQEIASLDGSKIGDRVRVMAESAVESGSRQKLSDEGRLELKQLLLSTEITEEEHKYLELLLRADAYEPDPQSFNQRPLWQRAATIAAGPAASLLFGLVLFVAIGATTGWPEPVYFNSIKKIADNDGPAARAGLKVGDKIVQINGTPISDGAKMVAIIHNSAGQPLALSVQRGDQTLSINVTPQLSSKPVPVEEDGKLLSKRVGLIGIETDTKSIFRRYPPGVAVKHGVDIFNMQIAGTMSGIFSKDVAKNTGGIIMIGTVVHEQSRGGLSALLPLAASLSLSLGIFNLFPIPVLDGGHLMLLAWEAIRRRKLTSREVLTAQVCGLSVIGVLFVLITCKDFMQEILPHLIKHG
ncbi:MAG TPA: RIP metalloprotease [Chthonomonadaceae bacterium]|nr:RIP metalloprotease [Chthonomonadaceae bacterium]